MAEKTRHSLTDTEITRIWDGFRSGRNADEIGAELGIKPMTVGRTAEAVMEIYENDVPAMIKDRKAGMTKSAIAEKYGYTLAGVRYYLRDVPKGEPEPVTRHLTFAEEWEAACRRLNPKAWEIPERRIQREEE